MKKIILILIISIFLFIGCSEQEKEEIKIIVNQEEIEKVNESDAIICDTSYIEFEGDCCIDENKNSICDETDIINNLKDEYTTISKEIDPNSDIIKVIITNTSDNRIDEKDEVKIYLKLKEGTESQSFKDLLIKFNVIAGGKTLFYNEDLGEEVYEVRYLSNDGKPIKQDYFSPQDLVEIKFKTGNSIGNSEYVYIKIVSNSGLIIPIHITTPFEFNNNNTQIYP